MRYQREYNFEFFKNHLFFIAFDNIHQNHLHYTSTMGCFGAIFGLNLGPKLPEIFRAKINIFRRFSRYFTACVCLIVGQIMYAASDVSKPSTIHAVNFGLEHGGAAQHRSELSDNFFFLPEIFREIFALRARCVSDHHHHDVSYYDHT